MAVHDFGSVIAAVVGLVIQRGDDHVGGRRMDFVCADIGMRAVHTGGAARVGWNRLRGGRGIVVVIVDRGVIVAGVVCDAALLDRDGLDRPAVVGEQAGQDAGV